MDAGFKKVLIGMAAGALGMAMVGCGGDAEVADDTGADDMSAGGEASCAGTEGDTEVDVDVETDDAAGGESACGEGSCGG
jgi:hypothetical protein